ncbi:hypothetical protein FHX74_003041 [Friedmanniella endophytica]|uniref:Uncharacterized protein n=1 Tax=Microlunatus kandeliicorticis TaxID=1759536 RepID=A0A7W3P6Y4_9ACTN|nr:hypothetical protein [Microlunatus kandeliicorticis]MBA8795405.1 hypothetical protein [Microlunatus kandeliicorticis]
MWAFLSARLRTWVIFAIAVPLLTGVISLIRRRLEQKNGQTPAVKVLTKLENFGRRKQRQAQQQPRR